MAKNTSKPEVRKGGGVSRRDFFKTGAAAGVGVAALSAPAVAQGAMGDGIHWDYEVDVVVAGGGCAGYPAAIRARDLGSNVLIIDQNADVGGRMVHSGGQTSLGGGDPLQLRDLAGESDPEGMITVPPVHDPEEITEDPDHLFRDHTDWSIVDESAAAPYRYNERPLHRGYADNTYATRLFLMDNYVRYGRISGTHGTGGMTRARRAVPIMRLDAVTDIPAGTIGYADASRNDDGDLIEQSTSFWPRRSGGGGSVAGPGIVTGGGILARCLEFSAREKGVHFMLNRHLDEIIRDGPDGRVIGVKASYTPRFDLTTGERLESWWSEGNIDERAETIYIRARKGVMVATGGHPGNPQIRSMFYPAFRDPVWSTSGQALLGRGRGADGSGIKAGLRVGANLAGMNQNLGYATTHHVSSRVATPDAYTDMYPGHQTFQFRGSTGYNTSQNAMEHSIAVNQVGRRFYNDRWLKNRHSSAAYPGNNVVPNPPGGGVNIVQYSWRNCSREWIREMYDRYAGLDAALAINEGSEAPDFHPGPIWEIFDAGTVERRNLADTLRFPFVNPDNGYFFQADTLEDLADHIYARHPYQRVPMTHLRETVDRWNGFVDEGLDTDFDRGTENDGAPMHRIDTPPFYASAIIIVWHDSYGGLRINGKCQVVDMDGEVIPGLYAGCEASGGGQQHGLGRGAVHGYIAGSNLGNEPVGMS